MDLHVRKTKMAGTSSSSVGEGNSNELSAAAAVATASSDTAENEAATTTSTASAQTAAAETSSTLCTDIVHQIAAQMFATMPPIQWDQMPLLRSIDFTWQNVFTRFMFHNRQNFSVCSSLFANMRRIRFGQLAGRELCCLYKKVKRWPFFCLQAQWNEERDDAGRFAGPYLLPKALLGQLLDQQRLRVSHVEIFPGFLNGKQPDVERWIGKRNVDAFAGIFLDRKDSVAAPVPSNVFLVIDVLEVNVCAHELEDNNCYWWPALLLLDAERIHMELYGVIHPGCPHVFACGERRPFPHQQQQIAVANTRTQEIFIHWTPGSRACRQPCTKLQAEEDEVEDASIARLQHFVHFTVGRCSELRKLDLHFKDFFNAYDKLGSTRSVPLSECMQRVHDLVVRVYSELLLLLDAGHAELGVHIVFEDCVQVKEHVQFLRNDHTAELRALGIPYTEWEEISDCLWERRLEAMDRRDRKHECCLQLFHNGDYTTSSSGDSNAAEDEQEEEDEEENDGVNE